MDKEIAEGERLYVGASDISDEGLKGHVDRYDFAAKCLKPDFIVIDAACGTGYGSEILARHAKRVLGLELSDHGLAWAKKYKTDAISFKKADLNLPLDVPTEFADAVISFETLEHIADQDTMLSEFARILKPGGLLIISSPDRETNKAAHVTNKFHIHELSKKEFLVTLRKHFTVEALYAQSKLIKKPLPQRMVKAVMRLDVFKLSRIVIRAFGLRSFVQKTFAPIENSPLQQIDFDSPNNYFVLLAICRKK